jgi:hypothetical protein
MPMFEFDEVEEVNQICASWVRWDCDNTLISSDECFRCSVMSPTPSPLSIDDGAKNGSDAKDHDDGQNNNQSTVPLVVSGIAVAGASVVAAVVGVGMWKRRSVLKSQQSIDQSYQVI